MDYTDYGLSTDELMLYFLQRLVNAHLATCT